MTDALSCLASIVILLSTFVTRPVAARCPGGWYINSGIRRDGSFTCAPKLSGDPLYDGAGGYPERGLEPPGILAGKIYCTGGSVPIVVSSTVVGCSR